jgi:hypothetical protein
VHLFGHHDGHHAHPVPTIPVAVDRDLAEAIVTVEASADDYLRAGTAPTRAALVDALGRLDALVSLGDDYANQVSIRGLGYGSASTGGVVGMGAAGVLGPGGSTPFVEDVPSGLLRAQLELARCARADVAEGATVPSESLRSAVHEVTAARLRDASGPAGPPSPSAPPEPPPRPAPSPPPSAPPRGGPI